ncbi:MAG: exodeoxyribonuclease VII large subunit [Flavobacteriales bacterium]|nr:exodeoxyribonuclease VII large subunit [Flavobacteriales bacterium]
MSELIGDRNVFSLLEISRSIEKTISKRYTSAFWVQAEMNKLSYHSQSGHCYPSLVEKKDNKVIAEINALIWSTNYQKINANFERVLKEPLKDGIKILFSATISYHPQYGLKLTIVDIDPSFTLGDLEKEKQETINRLQSEGIFDRNKLIPIAMVPQNIAIISDESSKGYIDFLQILKEAEHNWGYAFLKMLFPSRLQGDMALATISHQLSKIKKISHHFDAVAIVRGGGGDIGLSCYNNYDLAREIALFPIPVITGIGHATNLTVCEMVANKNMITPTKLAEFIIQAYHNFSVPVKEAEKTITQKVARIVLDEKQKLQSEIKLLLSECRNLVSFNRNNMKEQTQSLLQYTRFQIKSEKSYLKGHGVDIGKGASQFYLRERQVMKQFPLGLKKDTLTLLKETRLVLSSINKNLQNLSPQNVLKRGYSITKLNGKSLKSIEELNEGELLETILFDGVVASEVKSKTKRKSNE